MLEQVNKIEDLDREIFSTLSKEGSFRILDLASSKLAAKTGKWRELGLSKRQYYSRLRSLKDTFLIKKEGESYKLTELGEKIYNLTTLLKNTTQKSGGVNPQNLNVSEGPFLAGGINKFLENLEKKRSKTVLLKNYETLVKELVKQIKATREEFYLASRYTDHRVLRALLNIDEEITVKGICSATGVKSAIERLKAIDKLSAFERLLKFANHNARSCPKLPYSFALRDQKYVGLEIPNPSQPDQFFLGFILEGREIYDIFYNVFQTLYKLSGESLSK